MKLSMKFPMSTPQVTVFVFFSFLHLPPKKRHHR
jgi:hypothetical protein